MVQKRIPLVLSALACFAFPLMAQTFEHVSYSYRIEEKSKPIILLGTLSFDPGHKAMTFAARTTTHCSSDKMLKQGLLPEAI
jgi:hypothetical protein